jgi:hypothetical protein
MDSREGNYAAFFIFTTGKKSSPSFSKEVRLSDARRASFVDFAERASPRYALATLV